MLPAERHARCLIDFDEIGDWAPKLSDVLSQCVPHSFERRVADAAPGCIEDALDLLFESTVRDAVIDATLAWIRSSKVVGYHGSRLTDEEVASVRSSGLMPLEAETRRDRLVRALSAHPRWHEVEDRLESTLRDHGPGGVAGRREEQAHLTLSRGGLINGFNGRRPCRPPSGKVVRYRLNPGGNRDANRALHVVVLNRLRRDPRTQEYLARRTSEGKTKRRPCGVSSATSPARPTARSY